VKDKPIYGEQKNTWEEAGKHEYGIKAISEGVVGMKKGDKKTVVMEFDKKFEVKELAGKKVSYELEVLEVREKKLPEMNEEFFKNAGVKDEAELKAKVKESLENRAKEEQEQSKRRQVGDALIASAKFSLPESLLEGESSQILKELMDENARNGVSEEELQKRQKEMLSAAKDAAEKRVRLRLILREIVKTEKLELSEEDFQRWIMSEAMRHQTSPDKIVKELQGDRERTSNLVQSLKLARAMQLVMDAAKVEEAKDEKKK
jgi:trigger factor